MQKDFCIGWLLGAVRHDKTFRKRNKTSYVKKEKVWQPYSENIGGFVMKNNDIHSLSHSRWRCKYHIVFAPKYRRMVIYNKLKVDIGKILRQL